MPKSLLNSLLSFEKKVFFKNFFFFVLTVLFLVVSLLSHAVAVEDSSTIKNNSKNIVNSEEGGNTPPIEILAQEMIDAEDPGEFWSIFFTSRTRTLIEIGHEISAIEKDVSKFEKRTEKTLIEARQEYSHILALSQTGSDTPAVLVPLDDRLKTLAIKLEKILLPLTEYNASISEQLAVLEEARTQAESAITEIDQSLELELITYKSHLQLVLARCKNLSDSLADLSSPIKEILNHIIALHSRVKTNLPYLWSEHYLDPSAPYFNPSAWQAIPKSIEFFLENNVPHIWSEFPQTRDEWETCILRFSLIMLFFSLFIYMIRSKVLALIKRERLKITALENVDLDLQGVIERQDINSDITSLYTSPLYLGTKEAFRGFLWIAVALSLYFASATWESGHDGFRGLVIPANIILLCGKIILAWALRSIYFNYMPSTSPFMPAIFLIITSLIILFLNPPLPLLGALWLVCIAISRIRHHYFKKHINYDHIHKLELIPLTLKPYILWISFAIAFFGWGRLAILFYMFFVGISVSLQLGYACMKVMDMASSHFSRKSSDTLLTGILLGITVPFLLIFVAFLVILWIIAYPGGAYFLEHIARANFTFGKISFDSLRILFIFTAFYLIRSFTIMGQSFLARLPDNFPRFDRRMVHPSQTAFKYLLWGIFFIYALNLLGVRLEKLAFMAGGLGVGIGLGLQGLVNNVISGLTLIFGRNLQEGDVIDLGTTRGHVRKVNLRSTTVETYENAIIFVPNTELVANRVTNWTRNSTMVRREVSVGVAYGSDVALVQELLRQVAMQHPDVKKDPAPYVVFNHFGASSLDFLLRVWLNDIDNSSSTCSDLRISIDKVFREHGVEIAFPQMDLHLRSDRRLQEE